MAASTSSSDPVGGNVTRPPSLKATTPILIEPGCCSTKVRAAALAASIRLGSRSVACMLLEASKASTTVPSRRGMLTLVSGRAKATMARMMAARKKANGM